MIQIAIVVVSVSASLFSFQQGASANRSHQNQSLPRSQARLTNDAVLYHGTYVNVNYGFSILIPEGLEGEGAASGAPNHGFVVHFSKDPNDTLAVDAYYEAAEMTGEASGPVGNESAVLRRMRVNIGGLDGNYRLARLKNPRPSETTLRLTISATRKTGDVPIFYNFSLTTRESLFTQREKVLGETLKTFKLLPLP